MGFELKMGFVGTKEIFIAKKYIEDAYKNVGIENVKLWVEKKHQNGVRGQLFYEIDELLKDNVNISSYSSLEDFVIDDCGAVGIIDELIQNNVDENKSDEDFNLEELKNIVKEHYYNTEFIEALEELKENETLYILNDCNGYSFGTDKENLILENLFDGQYQRCFDNTNEILEAIENKDELVIVFIYNYMNNYEVNKYKDEFYKLTEEGINEC